MMITKSVHMELISTNAYVYLFWCVYNKFMCTDVLCFSRYAQISAIYLDRRVVFEVCTFKNRQKVVNFSVIFEDQNRVPFS